MSKELNIKDVMVAEVAELCNNCNTKKDCSTGNCDINESLKLNKISPCETIHEELQQLPGNVIASLHYKRFGN